jgi:hypothetical protein
MVSRSNKYGNTGYRIDDIHGISKKKIQEICKVSRTTAYRYLKDGEAPYAEAKLIDLYCRGRILPEKWNHTFINKNGDMEINGVEAVKEGQICNMSWAISSKDEKIYRLENELKHTINSLTKEIVKARVMIAELDEQLESILRPQPVEKPVFRLISKSAIKRS